MVDPVAIERGSKLAVASTHVPGADLRQVLDALKNPVGKPAHAATIAIIAANAVTVWKILNGAIKDSQLHVGPLDAVALAAIIASTVVALYQYADSPRRAAKEVLNKGAQRIVRQAMIDQGMDPDQDELPTHPAAQSKH